MQWSESVKHLGNLVDSTLFDSLDCRYKRSMFIGYVNKRISKFCHLQPHILINLFKHTVALSLDLVVGGRIKKLYHYMACGGTKTFEFAQYYPYMDVRSLA